MNRRNANLGYFFSSAAARFPDKVAVIDLHGGIERLITYAGLDERADRVAGLMRGLEVAPGERVGMIVGNRVEFLEIFFGTMRAGAIPVAINTRLARDTLKFILEDAGCRAVFVEPAVHADAIAVADAAPIGHRIALDAPSGGATGRWLEYAAARDESPRLDTPPTLPADAQAFQPYTSGSTGLPKGAIMTHAGMVCRLQPALLALHVRGPRTDRAAAVSQECDAWHGEADAVAWSTDRSTRTPASWRSWVKTSCH